MMPFIVHMMTRVFDSASANRELWVSLTCAWIVLWAAGVYGSQHLIPQMQRNSEQILAMNQQMGDIKDDVAEVKEDVSDVKVTLLIDQIIEARRVQCSATSADSKRFFTERLADVMRQYERSMGQRFRLPGCDELQ